MGRSVTPAFRIEFRVTRGIFTPHGWDMHYGRPTQKNLASYVDGFHASIRPGGANEHLGSVRILEARLVRQATGEVVATWKAPLFEVLS